VALKEINCLHRAAHHRFDVHFHFVDGQGFEQLAEDVGVATQVEQRAQQHVAGRAGETIEIKHISHDVPFPDD